MSTARLLFYTADPLSTNTNACDCVTITARPAWLIKGKRAKGYAQGRQVCVGDQRKGKCLESS